MLALSAFTSGCVQVRFERDTRMEPLPEGALATLSPGATKLEDVLRRLGPPLFAWELPQQGSALAWGWFHSGGWQVKISVPTGSKVLSPYIDYGNEVERMRGAVLFFDRDLKLVSMREGSIRDLREETRARPDEATRAEDE